MEKRVTEGRADLKPDKLLINTAMGAQAKHSLGGMLSRDSVRAAERLLDALERKYTARDATLQPTARMYSKFVDLYAKNGRADDLVVSPG